MKYLFFPGITGVRCQSKTRYAVSAVDSRGAKRLKTGKLKNKVVFWNIPIVRGITYFFCGVVATIKTGIDSIELSGTSIERGMSDKVAEKLNVKKEVVAMTFLLVISLAISLFLFGFIPAKLSFMFIGMSMNFVLRNFIIALTKVAIFFIILLIFRFLPPMQDLYKFNGATNQLDYEVELVVIIGRNCRNVARENALEYVFGYSIANDISARDLQLKHKQWYAGKSLEGAFPMGPCIVLRDSLNVENLSIKSYVNGELRQNSNTSQLIFDIPYVISELSSYCTLKTGSIISMGTPSGVGMGFTPPRFLQNGDIVVCEIEGIGQLTTHIRA